MAPEKCIYKACNYTSEFYFVCERANEGCASIEAKETGNAVFCDDCIFKCDCCLRTACINCGPTVFCFKCANRLCDECDYELTVRHTTDSRPVCTDCLKPVTPPSDKDDDQDEDRTR